MRSVKGIVGYILVRTADGCYSVSICNDKAGTEESVKKASEWIKANAASTGVGAPHISEGSVVVHIK
jgi:hypothetical protein